ncbi:Mitochondrial distribution and morphology protein 12 [Madurella mycetomatis]|uniref:Mitochondrial distribution and morphology protein 12 n=1 Tax=Madurella mycetomatis TaxID=100816 RepID=A0A175WHK3_9PEZI|nr:Mitochondrial distribution and morphology protein 12 [Madurella mycetomatis]
MSIDLNWETVTGGPDGEELAGKIRDFIHTKFQSVPLPRFIKSVTVHDFQFGTIPPEIELKDITDPLPDFYEDHVDSDLASDDSDSENDEATNAAQIPDERRRRQEAEMLTDRSRHPSALPPHLNFGMPGAPGIGSPRNGDTGSPFLRVSTPGIPGGTSNLHYFHSHLATGLSGTQTPLAAVAGAQHLSTTNWLEGHGHSSSAPNLRNYAANFSRGPPHRQQPSHSRNTSQSSISIGDFSPTIGLTPTSPTTGLGVPGTPPPLETQRLNLSTYLNRHRIPPPTRDAAAALVGTAVTDNSSDDKAKETPSSGPSTNPKQTQHQQKQEKQQEPEQPRLRERRLEDMQAVFRIRYAGDVKLLLTADILLDYPMPSFVGIPVRLSITGLTFDGVGVLAKIRKRVHFCFLSPEDAIAAVGDDNDDGGGAQEEGRRAGTGAQQGQQHRKGGSTKLGGLLQEIRVESEIGERESGRQSLKNVGKVERFVLEQVRRIFEDEFVYPSFWTFLV